MSGVELEKTESNAEEREEDVDGWNGSGDIKEDAEHVVDELREEDGDDGGADQGAGQAGEGAKGDGEVDPGTEKDKVRGGGAIVSFQHRLFADLKMPQYQEHNQKQLVLGLSQSQLFCALNSCFLLSSLRLGVSNSRDYLYR